LIERTDGEQLGITNNLNQTMTHHSSFVWRQVEVFGSFSVGIVLDTKKVLKRWLKKEIGLVKGTSEIA
tara:strand:- start:161 stop:364 length:204 start_codon:yes stop_codon:yes gene_type:complete